MTIREFKIVAQKWLANATGLKRALIAVAILFGLPVCGVLTAFGVATDTQLEATPRQEINQALALPVIAAPPLEEERFRRSDRVQRGDSVAALLQRLQVDDPAAFQFLRTSASAKSIYQLRPGRTVQAVTDGDGELYALNYLYSPDQMLSVQRQGNAFVAQELKLSADVETVRRSGVIKSSLYGASDEANIPDQIATQIARVFSTDIDFHVDLRRGDRFSVIYEMLYHDGEFLRPGRVLSAEFVNNGRKYEAFLFTDSEGNEGYYSADGQNRAKSFLRSPLAFSRVSSGFGGRVHPIFKNWRAHTGTDFAAPRGTPVWATSDGVVLSAGAKGGYGNAVEIRHAGSVTTLYGHLTGFAAGIRRGARVTQGQTIAYVGATGWATGPHLHYEFRIAGVLQNPMKVALPKAEPLAPRYRTAFQQTTELQGTQLALLRNTHFDQFE
ncbi:MAG: M23 family metallopeptidase [Betaproteobacteria bacterium]|nr:M23 family metallopeptidase [Betaproteobacteria bacterium]